MGLYEFGDVVLTGLCRCIFRYKVEGLENIPKDENFIVCCNHRSNLDPPFLGVCLPFKICYMAKEELFKNKLFAKLITTLGAFPIKRGKHDIAALKTALSLIKQGKRVAIFPEGGRSHDEHLRKGKTGAALIAIKAGVNILPVGIDGKYRLFGRIRTRIGKPIDLSAYFGTRPDSNELKRITDEILMPEIGRLANMPTYEEYNKKLTSGE
ncbi:MAG TPA: 1-acyl-sn-glycerol-3-phosphate acyltransferase [Firmicutes bacterium]|nr:1-acyl-sn-glycerol-3-phosphate acyltransferase [Bacillota bacterium]